MGITAMIANKPCPFCGGTVDPEGWMGGSEGEPDEIRGPECNGCGATAPTIEIWNYRAASMSPVPVGMMSPAQAFEHHSTNPNLFRSLARRLSDYAIYIKVGSALMDAPMEEGSIGPDCALATLLLNAMADVVEESKE